MNLDEAVRIRLNQLLKEKGFHQYQLYKEGGIPRATISQTLSGKNGKIKLDTLYQIISTMGVSLKEFFDDPIFDNILD